MRESASNRYAPNDSDCDPNHADPRRIGIEIAKEVLRRATKEARGNAVDISSYSVSHRTLLSY